MNRIQKVSAYLVTVFNLLIIALPIACILLWLFIDSAWVPQSIIQGFAPVQTPQGLINLNEITWTHLSKTIALVSHLIEQLPFFIGLFVLKSIFKNYEKGAIFSTENACSFKKLGWLFIAQACIAKPLSDMLFVGAATLSNPPGHRYISFGFGTPNIESVFCGIMMIVISWVMLEASKLHDEQSFTI